jgi:hypothetical protein
MSTGIVPASAYRYENIPNAVRSRHRTVKYTPVNGSTFKSSRNTLIRIEVRSTGFLVGQESYLKFSITNNATNGHSLDLGAHAVIQRFRLVCNGIVLQDILNYHQLVSLLTHVSTSDDYQRMTQILSGGKTTIDANIVGDGNNAIPNGATRTFSIPLMGLLSGERYLPLGLMTGGLVIELYLEPLFAMVFNGAGAPTGADISYEVSAVEYVAKIVEIEDETALNYIKSMMMSGGGLQIKADDWVCHQNNIPANTASATLTIPDRSSSLKHLITTLHHSAPAHNVSGIQSYSWGVSRYIYKVGSNNYPIQDVVMDNGTQNYVEPFIELQKCFNTGLWSTNAKTYANSISFDSNIYTQEGCFAMAYDFENYSASDNFSGLDLSTLGLPCTINFTLTAVATSINVNTFAHFDCVYTIDANGIISKTA